MTADEWAPQWARLDHFRVGSDVDRERVKAEWFAQLKHYHVDAVDAGITLLIGHAKDTFLPGLGLLKDYIGQKFDRYQRTDGKCSSCHGSSWIDAPAFRGNGLIYANALQRCPDCGIPAPSVDSHSRRERVSDLHLHEYLAGRFGREQMPEGLQAQASGAYGPDGTESGDASALSSVIHRRST